MLRTIATTALVTAAAAAATTASAQSSQSCGDREEVVARLGDLHA
jgi:hypothetical protein